MRIFKISLFLLLLTFLSFAINISKAYSQNDYAYSNTHESSHPTANSTQQRDNSKSRLVDELQQLNKVKGVFFMFSNKAIGNQMVNQVNDMSPATELILDKILENTRLSYKKINSNTFVILPAKEKEKAAPDIPPASGSGASSFSASHVNFILPYDVISGKVIDNNGNPITGVSVEVKGTNKGTSTNSNGIYSIEASKGDVLVFTSVGFETRIITVGNDNTINVQLNEQNKRMNEIVVTALGINRQAKSLTYSVQTVDNSALNNVKDANLVNNLTGRVAGVNITRSSSGIGGSARVVIRGNKSTRENQPLYVIDGVPMTNANPAQPADEWGQALGFVGVDGGDGISNLNPEDIQSVTVLKGASAAALYGSQAANGVILITTKKGKAGSTKINFSSGLTFDTPLYEQALQFKYGQTTTPSSGNPGSRDSWGSVVNSPDWVTPFFNTGLTNFNAISLSGGTDKSQTYFSYSYTDNKGVMPTSNMKKHNLNFHQTTNFFNDRLVADVNALYIHESAHNRPVSGLYDNPLSGLYEFPRGLDFNKYKTYEVYSTARNTNVQNWWDNNYDSSFAGTETEQNPYWLLNRNTSDNVVNRIYTNLSLKFKINDWLSLQARGNIDKSINDINVKSFATTSIVLTANNGGYTYLRAINTQLYGDLLLSADKKLSDNLGLKATIGSSINDGTLDQNNFGTKNSGDGLRFANVFTLANILPAAITVSQTENHRQVQAAFATAQLNWKDYLYLDLTGRNDWSSTFAFTPVENKGYFYYSAGITGVLSDMFKMGEPITFSKIRLSYAKVGNDVNIYSTNPVAYTIDNQNGSVANTKTFLPGTYLKPEDNRSFEAGTEWHFLNDRLGFDFTYYINNNYRQYIETPAPNGSGYNTYYLNSGNIRNNGVELSVFFTPVKTNLVSWTSTINYAYNKNKVIQIADPALGVTQTYFTVTGIGNLLYASYIKEGGSWGDIYGHFFKRAADGTIVVDANGTPERGSDSTGGVGDQSLKYLGNPNPKFTLGWSNTINLKNFSVDFLIDGRFGGKVMSMTQAILDGLGDSKVTADARDAGGVKINAEHEDGSKVSSIDPKVFYQGVGGLSGIGEYYMYDATAVRLREVSIGYHIPVKASWINNLTFSLIGRNLFFFYKKAPFDPETSMATNNGLQGIETFSLPTTRSIGFQIKAAF
ncbi:MAG: SusC/RagA family TonB-linked outer membrane protein [Ginsengibacter sp.]